MFSCFKLTVYSIETELSKVKQVLWKVIREIDEEIWLTEIEASFWRIAHLEHFQHVSYFLAEHSLRPSDWPQVQIVPARDQWVEIGECEAITRASEQAYRCRVHRKQVWRISWINKGNKGRKWRIESKSEGGSDGSHWPDSSITLMKNNLN